MWLVGTAWSRLDASLRARVFIPSVVLYAVTLALMVGAAVEMLGRDLEDSVKHRLEVFAHVVADGLTTNMIHGGPRAMTDMLSVVNEHHDEILSVSMLGPGGLVVSSSSRELVGTRPWRAPRVDRTLVTTLDSGYAVLRPIANEPRCTGCHGTAARTNGFLDVRFSRRPVTSAKLKLAKKLVLAAAGSFLVLLGITWWLLGREVVSPIQRFVRTMRRAESGELTVVADEGRPDELGRATRGFDSMMAALRRSTAELEMVDAERMVRADRFAAVGEMATGLAHEIKNPLAGLSGALELLAEDLVSSPRQAEIVAEMRHSVARLAQTMESLLRFARPARARMRSMDVNGALENVLFLVKQQRSAAPVVVEQRLDPALPPVSGDPAQLEQVFLNVCLNACQAMSAKGGKLTVRSFARDGQVVLQFADTGPGIAPEVRPLLFKPFFTTRREGNGLGLAISARIVVEHGGQIQFTCPPEGGTVFSLTLPAAAAKEQAA